MLVSSNRQYIDWIIVMHCVFPCFSPLTDKKGAIITNIYNQFYLSRTNPFEDALKLYANCSDIDSSKKNSISYAVIEELNRFKQNNCLNANGLLDDNLRMVALNFARTSGQQSRLKLIVSTFELVGHNLLFIDRIRDLIAQHNYKDVRYQLFMFLFGYN